VQLLFVIDSATGYAEALYKFICDLNVARKGCKGLTRSHRPFSCPQNKHADRQSDRSTPRRACMHDVIVSPRHSQKHSYSDSNVQLLNPDCAETVNTRTLDWPDSSDYAHLILKTVLELKIAPCKPDAWLQRGRDHAASSLDRVTVHDQFYACGAGHQLCQTFRSCAAMARRGAAMRLTVIFILTPHLDLS